MRKLMWRRQKTLAARFVFMLCVTFLPLGILAFVVSCAVVGISAERTYEAYEHEMEGSFVTMQESMRGIENQLDYFVLNHLSELTNTASHNDIKNYEMIGELGEIHSMQPLEGVVYLFDRRKARMYTKYNYDTYEYLEMKNFRDKLLYRGYAEGTSNGWNLYYFDNRAFLRRSYSYTCADVGFLLDVSRFLDDMELLDELKTDEIYISDESKILLVRGEECTRYNEKKWEELLAERGGFRFLLWDGNEIGLHIAFKIPAYTLLQKMAGSLLLLLLVLLLEVAFVILFWRLIRKWVVQPIVQMNEAMDCFGKDKSGQYRIAETDRSVAEDFRHMFDNFNEMAGEIEEGRHIERQFHHMKLDNLKLRMNPHMLMNAFNLIYSMAQVKNYEGIQEFALCLVDYFRYMLKETTDLVTIREEMNFVSNYLRIQKIRFPDRFNCVYSMADDVENALIPPLLIENFVENSVKYAMIPKKTTEILINIRREGAWCYISVTDTGRGIRPEVMKDIRAGEKHVDGLGHEHIGIYNCRKWMEYFYHGQGRIRITSALGEGTQVWIELPFMEKQEEKG